MAARQHTPDLVTGKHRNPWLDFLRAMAILGVLVHHLGQEWPITRRWLLGYTQLGADGVDLFFVLSGWLIGGLFWREMAQAGQVRLFRFWARRWMRTLPPYLGGLLLAWLAVWVYRGEPFDPAYLLFLQNYYHQLPFFFVSWSLCIEEHFYLFAPLLFVVLAPVRGISIPVLFLLPTLFRFLEYVPGPTGFGYYLTATHLYADGLLLSFGLAWIQVNHAQLLARIAPIAVLVSLLASWGLWLDLGQKGEYVLNPLLLALLFAGLLVALVNHPWRRFFLSRPLGWIARISYSVYLTHALVIHALVRTIAPNEGWMEIPALVIYLSIALLVGWLFYLVFERTSFIWRERVVPAGAR